MEIGTFYWVSALTAIVVFFGTVAVVGWTLGTVALSVVYIAFLFWVQAYCRKRGYPPRKE